MGCACAVTRPDVPNARAETDAEPVRTFCNTVVTLLSHEAFGDFYQRQVRQTSPQKELRLIHFSPGNRDVGVHSHNWSKQ
jgi:hypothetical protein